MEQILWLSPEPPTKYSGGAKSIYNCIKHLSNNYKIDVFCLPSNLIKIKENMIDLPENVSFHIFSRNTEKKHLALTMSWLQGKPYKMVKNSSVELTDAYENILRERKISVIFVEHSYMTQFAWNANKPRIVNMQNIESMLAKSEYSVENDWGMKLLWKREEKCWTKWERKIAYEYEQITVISNNERHRLINLICKKDFDKINVLERGTECIQRNNKANIKNEDILFVGSMAYKPNIDAVRHFALNIFPKISQLIKGVTFTIVGSNPTEEVMSLSALPSVNVVGFVDSLDSYYERASIFVIPMRSGGGVKMKLLEAMGRGMPIVSTVMGADGVNVSHDKEVMIAKDDDEFAQYCIKLLRNKKQAEEMGKRAYDFALKNHSWEKTANKLVEIIDRAKYQFKNKKKYKW